MSIAARPAAMLTIIAEPPARTVTRIATEGFSVPLSTGCNMNEGELANLCDVATEMMAWHERGGCWGWMERGLA